MNDIEIKLKEGVTPEEARISDVIVDLNGQFLGLLDYIKVIPKYGKVASVDLGFYGNVDLTSLPAHLIDQIIPGR